ncbi:serine/threonine protein kinase, partial [Pyxidicoccus sp. 3LG]
PQLHNGLGSALLWQAEQRWEDGGDPEPVLIASQQSYEQARAAAPGQAFAYNNLGELWALRATIQLARREAPGPSVRAALEAYRKALELLPDDAALWASVARVNGVSASWVLEQGGDPRKELAQAEEALARAHELNPLLGSAWLYLGEARGTRARWRVRGNTARNEDFEEAAKALQQAVELQPQRLGYRLAAGNLQREWAAFKQRQGEDPAPMLKRGLELAEHVLSARPGWARARLLRASVLLALAEDRASTEQQRQAWRKQAEEDVEQALRANPRLAPAWKARTVP